MNHNRPAMNAWPKTPRWVVATVALVIGGIVFYLLRGALMPFALGIAVAYLLDPVADRLEGLGLPRALATLLLLLTFFGLVVFAVLTLVPLVVPQIAELLREMPGYIRRVSDLVTATVGRVSAFVGQEKTEAIQQAATNYADVAAGWLLEILRHVWSGGLALFDLISLFVVTPIVSYYLLRDFDKAVGSVATLVPRPYAPKVTEVAREANQVLGRFVRGQGFVALLLGSFYAIALTAAGLNFGMTIGIVSGVLSVIPFIGSIFGFVVSVCVAIAQFDSWVMWVVIAGIFVFGQFVEGNFITPRLIGDAVGLHPVWIIFALLAGGTLFGVTGVMLAVPAAAVIGVAIRHTVDHYHTTEFYRGEHPEPPRSDKAAADD